MGIVLCLRREHDDGGDASDDKCDEKGAGSVRAVIRMKLNGKGGEAGNISLRTAHLS